MAAPLPLRCDFDAAQLRLLARHSRDPDQTRRLLALAAIYDGASRAEAARLGCVTVQIVRDWVERFNARGPEGLLTGRAPGAKSILGPEHRQALAAVLEAGPDPEVHGVVRWRIVDLVAWLCDTFAISISEQTMGRELRAMNYRKLSARPRHHEQDAEAIAHFNKPSPPVWQKSRKKPVSRPSI